MGDADDLEAGAGQQPAQRVPAVPAHFVAEHRVVAFEHVHCGDIHDDKPARSGNPEHFGGGGPFDRRVERVEHVEGRHHIEGVSRKRNGRHAGAGEAGPPLLASDIQAYRGEVEAVRAAEATEHFDVGARTAPAVQDASGRYSLCGGFEQRLDKTTKTAKPEVARFGQRSRAQQVIHRKIVQVASHLIDTAARPVLCAYFREEVTNDSSGYSVVDRVHEMYIVCGAHDNGLRSSGVRTQGAPAASSAAAAASRRGDAATATTTAATAGTHTGAAGGTTERRANLREEVARAVEQRAAARRRVL